MSENPFHKPAGHYAPEVDPPPVHALSVEERFKLMLGVAGKLDAYKTGKSGEAGTSEEPEPQ